MPQASYELRQWIAAEFKCDWTEAPVERFLESKGWRNNSGTWMRADKGYVASKEELNCLEFMADEWDYGVELA